MSPADALTGVIISFLTLEMVTSISLLFSPFVFTFSVILYSIAISSTLFNATLLMALPAAITLFKLSSVPDPLYVTTASVYVFSRALSASSV